MGAKRVDVLSRKVVFDNFFKIEKAMLRFERFDGSMSSTVKRLSLERGDAVAALLFNRDSGRLLLTYQFKYPTLRRTNIWRRASTSSVSRRRSSRRDSWNSIFRSEAGGGPRLRPGG